MGMNMDTSIIMDSPHRRSSQARRRSLGGHTGVGGEMGDGRRDKTMNRELWTVKNPETERNWTLK